jgi:tRNA nucleotidyltransferase (CCA-adding enzyme)
VKKKLKDKKIANEVAAAKQFCKAQGIYGAESYINGFSGYGLECLVIYYKSLERMLKALAKVKERIVIDPEKKFKNKEEALVEINEGKLNSPIVLIDPTWKERNALAALSWETFLKFQNIARDFLKKPDASFFERREINGEEIKKEAAAKKMEFVIIKTRTDRQEGDIAGTKLKKFFNFIVKEISTYFEVVRSEFAYDEKHGAESYFALKSKGAVEKKGPPVALKEAAEMFRKNNKCVYEKNEFLYAKTKINFSASDFLKDFFKKYRKKIGEMGITAIEVGN